MYLQRYGRSKEEKKKALKQCKDSSAFYAGHFSLPYKRNEYRGRMIEIKRSVNVDFKKMILVLAPPVEPICSKGAFIDTEQQIGTSLPSDYKEFISHYGLGSIDDFIWILNPFTENKNLNFLIKKEEILNSYKLLKKEFPNDYIHEIYPNDNGLLPFGLTDNGDELFWLVRGEPDNWKVVVYRTRSEEYIKYDFTLIEFIHKIITREINCGIFPDDFPNQNPFFSVIN